MKIIIALCLGLSVFGFGCGSSEPSKPSGEKDASAEFVCPPNDECVRWWADFDSCWAEFAQDVSCGDGGVCDGEGYCGTK